MSKKNRKAHAARRPFETAAFRLGLAIIPRLPRRILLGIAWLGGQLGFYFNRSGRSVGLSNLDIAFGGAKTAKQKRTVLRTAYVTMTRTFLDVIWFGTHSENRLATYVELDDSVLPFLHHKNQICITAHFGNWEVIGLMMALRGFPFHSIAMPVKNPDVDRMLIARREITGQKIIPREGALRKLLSVLRNNGKTAFLVDQNTKESEGGIWVNYFDLPILVTPAPAALAIKTGTEMVIGFCVPLRGGRYRIYASETIRPPEKSGDETAHALTRQILGAIEREVRWHPEHWLWMYKRWKTIKPDTDPVRYPPYSRQRCAAKKGCSKSIQEEQGAGRKDRAGV